MGHVEKRYGNYRVRYSDPDGNRTSKTFERKIEADRFLRDMEVAVDREQWVNPRNAEMTLTDWSKEFLLLSRRLARSTQETYERDLNKYVLPKFGRYRLGRVPADEIENWLNDEIAAGIAPSSAHRHYRTLRRLLQVAVDKEKILNNPCDRVHPPNVPKREMTFSLGIRP